MFTGLLPFIKILLAFTVMLVGMRRKVGLGLSIFLGALVLAVLSGLGPSVIGKLTVTALIQEKFLFLLGIVGLILILSDGLEKTGQSKRLMDGLSGYLTNPRLRLIFFPALIGLLPMPGGAVFSAPMVKTISENMSLSQEQKAAINYWFRHVWEMAWPLYPGIILTVALADIPISALISKTWPGVIGMFGFGYIFLLRAKVLKIDPVEKQVEIKQGKKMVVLRESLPLLVAIGGAVGLEWILAGWFHHIAFEWGVLAALAGAVVTVMVQNRLKLDFIVASLKKKSLWTMLSVIAAVFVFKESMAAAKIVEEMAASAGGTVALFAAAVFLPFLVGMIAGINVAFVGATFPLLIGLLHTLNMESQMIAYLVLASFAGFTGVLISPIHICFVLTCDFFQADIVKTWRSIFLPTFGFSMVGVMMFFLLL